MPRREDIERFAQVLNSLGDEPAIRAARAESIEEVAAPAAEGAPQEGDSLDALPFDAGEGDEAGAGTAEQESLQDIFAGLDALPGDEAAPDEGSGGPPPIDEPSTPPETPGDDIDFSSLFGDETAAPPIEEIESPPPPAQGRAAEPAEKAPAPDEEAFSFPGGEPEGLQDDLAQMEVLPESLGEEEPAPAPEGESFEDLGAFAPDTGPASESAEGPASEAPAPGLEGLGGLDAFSTEAPSFEEPASEEPAAGEAGESFELPSLDDLSFGETTPDVGAPPEQAEAPREPSFEPPPAESEELPPGASFDLDTVGEVAEPPAGESAAEPDMDSLGVEGLGDLDEFSLPPSAEQFGIPAAVEAPKAKAKPRAERPAPAARPAPVETAAEPGEVDLSPEQFAQLKRTLESLPRNLKIAVQDLIGQGMVGGPDLTALIALLLRGASAQEIAALTGKITGKRIRIPAGYEKKTGIAFEEEQRTFGYAFRENILPIIRIIAITLVAGGLFGFLGYSYVWKPLSAYTNYRAGYAEIASDHYDIANERFDRATRTWQMKSWYYRYAEAFAGKRRYDLAEQKYDQLLAWQPNDKKGILDYARMESQGLANFEKADSLLQRILGRSQYDYDALLASGDNNLDWAEKVPARYEPARFAYATLIERYGTRDELLFRMLRYFIRTDKPDEVERLRIYYAQRPEVKVDAGVFAEMGGYLVDHHKLDFVQEVLFRADKAKLGLYEVHYNLARYYRLVKNAGDEKKALDATLENLRRNSTEAITTKRVTIEIDTNTRLGEYNDGIKEYITAETYLRKAASLVEQYRKMNLIPVDGLYGRPYADLGDLYYYIQGDMNAAYAQYQTAFANAFTSPELLYKTGYIQYKQGDYKSALATFTQTEDASASPAEADTLAAAAPTPEEPLPTPGQPPQNLLYALGNCFYQRGDFFAAQGYYLRLLDRLENRRAALGILHPEDQPSDRALLDSLVRVNNNLGVTLFRLSQRTGDRTRRSQSLVYFTQATEIADTLSRSPDTVQRSEDRSLPSLNMRGILYPVSGFVLQPSLALPKDFEAIDW